MQPRPVAGIWQTQGKAPKGPTVKKMDDQLRLTGYLFKLCMIFTIQTMEARLVYNLGITTQVLEGLQRRLAALAAG